TNSIEMENSIFTTNESTQDNTTSIETTNSIITNKSASSSQNNTLIIPQMVFGDNCQ
ncbi:5677_t:CDS:1, partial [Acaulospora morrowiae]